MKTNNKIHRVVSAMPPLPHSFEGHPFDIWNSQVCEWLLSQDEVRKWVFDQMKKSGFIKFDPITRKWSGVPMSAEPTEDDE